jgi:protein-L-isoaspartate(D-aspartate) O-methyltransferase
VNTNLKRKEMIEYQLKARGISNRKLLSAFLEVERHLFVREEDIDYAYEDYPLDIGHSQTISQPYIIALSLDHLELKKSDIVLEVGTGSGYQTALLSKLAKEVYTIELIPELHKKANKLLIDLGYDNVTCILGNGYRGYIDGSPYDKIVVSCASKKMPTELINQLIDGGKMVIPIEQVFWHNLYLITKHQNQINKQNLCAVRFVPMIDE